MIYGGKFIESTVPVIKGKMNRHKKSRNYSCLSKTLNVSIMSIVKHQALFLFIIRLIIKIAITKYDPARIPLFVIISKNDNAIIINIINAMVILNTFIAVAKIS